MGLHDIEPMQVDEPAAERNSAPPPVRFHHPLNQVFLECRDAFVRYFSLPDLLRFALINYEAADQIDVLLRALIKKYFPYYPTLNNTIDSDKDYTFYTAAKRLGHLFRELRHFLRDPLSKAHTLVLLENLMVGQCHKGHLKRSLCASNQIHNQIIFHQLHPNRRQAESTIPSPPTSLDEFIALLTSSNTGIISFDIFNMPIAVRQAFLNLINQPEVSNEIGAKTEFNKRFFTNPKYRNKIYFFHKMLNILSRSAVYADNSLIPILHLIETAPNEQDKEKNICILKAKISELIEGWSALSLYALKNILSMTLFGCIEWPNAFKILISIFIEKIHLKPALEKAVRMIALKIIHFRRFETSKPIVDCFIEFNLINPELDFSMRSSFDLSNHYLLQAGQQAVECIYPEYDDFNNYADWPIRRLRKNALGNSVSSNLPNDEVTLSDTDKLLHFAMAYPEHLPWAVYHCFLVLSSETYSQASFKEARQKQATKIVITAFGILLRTRKQHTEEKIKEICYLIFVDFDDVLSKDNKKNIFDRLCVLCELNYYNDFIKILNILLKDLAGSTQPLFSILFASYFSKSSFLDEIDHPLVEKILIDIFLKLKHMKEMKIYFLLLFQHCHIGQNLFEKINTRLTRHIDSEKDQSAKKSTYIADIFSNIIISILSKDNPNELVFDNLIQFIHYNNSQNATESSTSLLRLIAFHFSREVNFNINLAYMGLLLRIIPAYKDDLTYFISLLINNFLFRALYHGDLEPLNKLIDLLEANPSIINEKKLCIYLEYRRSHTDPNISLRFVNALSRSKLIDNIFNATVLASRFSSINQDLVSYTIRVCTDLIANALIYQRTNDHFTLGTLLIILKDQYLSSDDPSLTPAQNYLMWLFFRPDAHLLYTIIPSGNTFQLGIELANIVIKKLNNTVGHKERKEWIREKLPRLLIICQYHKLEKVFIQTILEKTNPHFILTNFLKSRSAAPEAVLSFLKALTPEQLKGAINHTTFENSRSLNYLIQDHEIEALQYCVPHIDKERLLLDIHGQYPLLFEAIKKDAADRDTAFKRTQLILNRANCLGLDLLKSTKRRDKTLEEHLDDDLKNFPVINSKKMKTAFKTFMEKQTQHTRQTQVSQAGLLAVHGHFAQSPIPPNDDSNDCTTTLQASQSKSYQPTLGGKPRL